MKKWLIAGCIVVVVIAGVIVFGLSKLGPIVKSAVNTYGPRITKTDVSLGHAGISLFSGEVKLNDFILGNPKGFQAPNAVRVGSVYVNVDEKSLVGDPIIVDKIEVTDPEITYEKKASTDNFKQLLANVQSSLPKGGKSPEKSADRSGEGKKLLVKDFILKGGEVKLAAPFLTGQEVSARLPEIHLTDIGKGVGAAPAEVFKQIFAALYQKISSPEVTQALAESIDKLSPQLQKQLEAAGVDIRTNFGKEAGKHLEKAKNALKGLLGK